MNRKISGFGSILLATLFLGNFIPSSVFALSADITRINFISTAQNIDTDTNSTVLSIQTQNATGTSEQTSETNTLNFSSTSTTGKFYNANASNCTSSLNTPFTLTMNKNSANKNFCYSDSTPGTYTITVSIQGQSWTPATQSITINAPATPTLSSIAITTPATKLNYTVGDTLDISDLVVTGTYSDNSAKTETITATNVSGFDSASPATNQILTITDGAQTATYKVNIIPAPLNITLKVYAGDNVLFDSPETVTACAQSPEPDAPITVNGKCAIEQAVSSPALSPVWIWYDANFHKESDLPKTMGFLDKLGDSTSDNNNFIYWGWFSNLEYGASALNSHKLSSNEELLLTYNSFPLRISASKTSGIVGDTITFTAEEKRTFNTDFSDMVWTPSLGVKITLGTQSCATIADGTCSIILNTAGSLKAVGSKTLFVPSAELPITVLSTPSNSGGGSSITPVFSVPNAISYLQSAQASDGSFGESDLYSDWAGVAIGASNTNGNMRASLLSYMTEHNTTSPLLTDNERRAIALLSLGQNPYAFNGTDYIASIVNKFDGAQFGDSALINDDIFALIPLSASGYTNNDDIIAKDISFILSKQQSDGSFEESVDLTAAAIQALSSFRNASGVSDALLKASIYLQNSQKSDGGFGNISSSSWAIQAMNALGASWTSGGKTTGNYLGAEQSPDGAALSSSDTFQNRIWATSYAIPAALGKKWSDIMQSVLKPENKNNANNISSNGGISAKISSVSSNISSGTSNTKNPEKSDSLVVCPAGDLFSAETGKACTNFSPTTSTNLPEIKLKTLKKPTHTSVSLKKEPEEKKETPTIENLASQNISKNTATALMAITDSSTQKSETPKRNWFLRFLDKIFSIF